MAKLGGSGEFVYVPGQQHWYHMGTYEKRKISSLNPNIGKRDLRFARIPRSFILCTQESLWNTTISDPGVWEGNLQKELKLDG